MGEQRAKKVSEEESLKQAEASLKSLAEKKSEDTKKPSVDDAKKTKSKSKAKSTKKKIRSKKYQESLKLVDRTKFYSASEAMELVKKTSYGKFKASVEAHIKLLANKKNKITIRGLVQMPFATGKVSKVAILDEALVEKIFKEKKTEYDILLAKPEMMSKMAKIAKILGPQGKMPNPKSGTITADPQKTIEEIKGGRVEYKADATGIVHFSLGKVSDESKNLLANYQALLGVLPRSALQGVTFCATMGPGIKVQI